MGTLAPPQDELASPSSLGSPFPDLIFPSPSFGSSIPADTDGVHYVLNSGFSHSEEMLLPRSWWSSQPVCSGNVEASL